jgi:hypothetical protein
MEMASKNRDKGSRVERALVEKLKLAGIPAIRVDKKRGQLGAEKSHDIEIPKPPMGKYEIEVKSRQGGKGFKQQRDWLEGNDFIFCHENHKTPMVSMSWETFCDILYRSKNP